MFSKQINVFQEYKNQQNIDENIFRDVLSYIKGFSEKIKQALDMGFGKSTKINFSIPKNLKEEAATTGKAGGEYVEFIIIQKVVENLRKHEFNDIQILVDGQKVSDEQFKAISNKRLEILKNSAGKNTAVISNWMKVGLNGAKDLYEQFSYLFDEAPLYRISINSTGVSLTGIEKSDIIIEIKKIDEQEFSRLIKLSLKSSLDEPWIFNGTQASEENTLLQLSTGFSITEAKMNLEKILNITDLEETLDELNALEETPEIKKQIKETKVALRNAKSVASAMKRDVYVRMYNNLGIVSPKYEEIKKHIDIIGELNRERAQFNKETKQFTKQKQEAQKTKNKAEIERIETLLKGRRLYKKTNYSSKIELSQKMFLDMTQEILDILKNRDESKLIQNLFKFAGIEKGLDYLVLGAEKTKVNKMVRTSGKSFINTLKKPMYSKMIDKIFEKLKNNEMRVSFGRSSAHSIECNITLDGKIVTVIPVQHHGNNMRIMGFELKRFYEEL